MGRLLVIGGDAAGMTGASVVRRECPGAEVAVVERGPYTSYSMCGLPYYIGGELDDPLDLVVRTPEEFRARGIEVHTNTEAIAIDPATRIVRVHRIDDGEEAEEPYDILLYATGAHPARLPVPGIEHGHAVQTLDEAERLRRALDERDDVGQVVVIGAGYIGMEIAEALVRRGLKATLIDRQLQVMTSLDPDMAAHVEALLVQFGVRVCLGESLREVRASQGRCGEVVTDADTYPADVVVLAMGSKPNVALARDAGCAVGASGALVVDDQLRTSIEGIWAAGDCIESRNLVSGAAQNVQLGTHANKQGKIAGLNIAALLGGRADEEPARFPGVVGTAVTRVCDWEIARTGLSEGEAAAAGLDCVAVRFTGTARSGYLPGAGKVFVKMLAEAGSGRVLGVQLVGSGNVAKRIDVAATWCQLGVRVQDAQLFDLAYAPPFGGVWDLLQVGARRLVDELGLQPRL
jgi:NADPH-dependent 2,4-dienoyl-CoA reductase/sulfur reductase-like enzyme